MVLIRQGNGSFAISFSYCVSTTDKYVSGRWICQNYFQWVHNWNSQETLLPKEKKKLWSHCGTYFNFSILKKTLWFCKNQKHRSSFGRPIFNELMMIGAGQKQWRVKCFDLPLLEAESCCVNRTENSVQMTNVTVAAVEWCSTIFNSWNNEFELVRWAMAG